MGKAGSIIQNLKWATIGISSAVISKFDREKGKKFLLESFREMPGVPAKFAQILDLRWNTNSGNESPSVQNGTSGESVDRQVLNLLSIEEVKSLIQQEMPELFEAIDEIDIQGMSASLGQVHWAKMKSGEVVAIKVQYPNLDSELPKQLESLFWLMEKSHGVRPLCQ
jgi:hypothetical protein